MQVQPWQQAFFECVADGTAVKRVFFDEGGTWQTQFQLMRREFRPGHWGVFHLAHFLIGVGGAVTTEQLAAKRPASYPACGSFRNPMSNPAEAPCPLAPGSAS